MNTKFHILLFASILLGISAHGALNLELASLLDIKRSGGTATSNFNTTIGDDGPDFQLAAASNGTFNIRNNGGGAPGDWEWRTSGVLENSTTVTLPITETWSSGVVPIDDSILAINPDRFTPTSIAFLIGRWNDDYYAFRFGLWNSSGVDRLRLYGIEAADVTILGPDGSIIPEAGSFALIAGLVGISCVCLRRPRRQRS
jgi:hypothetical protein